MDQVQHETCVVIVMVLLCAVALTAILSLVFTNLMLVRGNKKTLEHALAINDMEREYMRMRLDADKAEFLLREAREVAAKKSGRPNPPAYTGNAAESGGDVEDVILG